MGGRREIGIHRTKVPTKKIGTFLTPAIHKIVAEIETEIAVLKPRYG
jgi:hypothetical protein